MNLDNLLKTIQQQSEQKTIVIAHATDSSIFESAKKALEKDLASFIFIGPEEEMAEAKKQADFQDDQDPRIEWVYTENSVESAKQAVQSVKEQRADVLMKGMVSTSILLKAVLNKENGLRTGNVLSHLAGFSLPGRSSLLFVTDAAMNISPDLKEKKQIIENAVTALREMGVSKPKVAVLAAVETINPAMQATIDAASLTLMNQRNQISHCEIDGPLGFDNAVSLEAANQKGIESNVAGQADILMVPSIETGNVLYKSLTYFGQAVVGGMIVGAKAPIILTSRSDSSESKLFSMAMALSTAK
jgi:phosphate butyryltransferase